ncbi:MAG: hypothetical protein ACKV19_19415 [Verrucomicrobiales bacterium]
MERLPVVEVLQIHGILDGAGVLDVVLAEDRFARRIVVDVAGDGRVELTHGLGVETAALLAEHPGFEFRARGPLVRDVAEELFAIETEAVEHHLVVSFAAGGIIVMQFAYSAEAGLLPETRQMENADASIK